MPSINLNMHKKKRVTTLKKAIYQDIYQDRRWKKLRAWHVRNHPLCQDCSEMDPPRVTAIQEVHHIIPWETGSTPAQQDDLAFDPDNIVSLCTHHHKKRHQS